MNLVTVGSCLNLLGKFVSKYLQQNFSKKLFKNIKILCKVNE